MTTIYYLPEDRISGNMASLPEDEAHHAVQVLRQQTGDEIVAVDGQGGWYRISLERTGRKLAEGRILEKKVNIGEPEYSLTIGMAVLKNQKRFETFVEKAVEVGVTRIIPLFTSRVEKKSFKIDRVEKIRIAAMKQCGRSRLVDIEAATDLEEVIGRKEAALTLCCHEKIEARDTLADALQTWTGDREALILIGPEGGFTDTEIEGMDRQGVRMVSLGTRRLRAETAAIVASTGVLLLWS